MQQTSKYLPFDPHTRTPHELPPPNSCDCQFHISGDSRYKIRQGAAYQSEGATCEALLKMHRTLGIERGVLVQSTVYGSDNSIVLDALRQLGPRYRGIALIDDNVSDAELEQLHAGGVRGVRFSFGKKVNLIPTPELLVRTAARIKELGWVLKINVGDDGLRPLFEMIRRLKDQPVAIDHMAKVRGMADPNLPLTIELLQQGNVWLMLSSGHRFSTWPSCAENIPVGKAYVQARPDRLVWATDWPHALHDDYMPNDADLLELFYKYTDGDLALRKKILVDNATELYFRE